MLRIKERIAVWGMGTFIESLIDSPAFDVDSVLDMRDEAGLSCKHKGK